MATGKNKNSGSGDTPLPSAEGMSFGIIVSDWNSRITQALLQGAKKVLLKQEAEEENIHIYRVPGCFELPHGAQLCLEHTDADAVICLGCVIRGETPHFDYVAKASAKGILDISLKFSKPVIFGVLTTDNEKQARERAGGKLGNKGEDAAIAAIRMVDMKKRFG